MGLRPSLSDRERKAVLRARLVRYDWEAAKKADSRLRAQKQRERADRSPS